MQLHFGTPMPFEWERPPHCFVAVSFERPRQLMAWLGVSCMPPQNASASIPAPPASKATPLA